MARPAKIMRGLAGGGVVRLTIPADTLALAEGIESALSFTQLADVPSWAALSARNFCNIDLPASVLEVVIAADNDERGPRPGRLAVAGDCKGAGSALCTPESPARTGTTFSKEAAMADLGAAAAHAEIHDVELDAVEEIARLATLNDIDYERERVASARALAMRKSTLDDLVKKERKAIGTDVDGKQGRRLELPDTEPWPEPVNGDELITSLCGQIKRYVVLGDHDALAVALWVVHAHALDAAEHSPRLHIASPEKRCGKSTLLGVIEPMLPRALGVENITTSALFRTIEAAKPTLLLDEADSFLTTNEEMRGLLNAGHARSGTVIKAVGEDFEPRQFAVWAAIVIAGIGRIPATIEDRSITIQLRRKLPGEGVERLRSTRRGHIAELGRKSARWAAEHLDGLRDAEPELPDSLSDRMPTETPVWEPAPRQARFLACADFEVLYGGAAGGGKSDALLIDALCLQDDGINNKAHRA
ncbi:MAG TPA: toprim domain-containing protein, partial [Aestuariivirgaceae bacterium]|nr:toprim domain-containing protein [Aestuariivirgaceae bacterium]